MKYGRAVTCACGHTMTVESEDQQVTPSLGEQLFEQVREHVDKNHPTLNYSNKTIWVMLAEKAFTPSKAN